MAVAYQLRLFVTGTSPRTERAIANLRAMCEQHLAGKYDLVIVDVLEHPDVAETERILATPTLIKVAPPPQRRVTGDLTDAAQVMMMLGIYSNTTGGGSR